VSGRSRLVRVVAVAGLALACSCERRDSGLVQGWVEGEFVHVASPLAGELVKLAVARGGQVAPGDLLFELEDGAEVAARDAAQRRLAQAQADLDDARKGKRPSEIESLEAQVRRATAALALSEQELARQEGLAKSNATATTDVDRARADRDQDVARLAELKADLETARLGEREDLVHAAEEAMKTRAAELARAEWDLAQKRQTATQQALVFDTLFQQGEWVPAGRPVVSLLPPGNVKVRAFVPQARVSTIRPGDPVRVHVDGVASPYPGRVTFIAPQVEYTPPVIFSRESREKLVILVEARFDDATAARLQPGQPVDVAFGE
jgi:HlyD family secretion protein